MTEPVLFVGPSGANLPAGLLRGLDVRPPAVRGDVDRLLEQSPPGAADRVLLLADGAFGHEPAVGHAELCRALDAGWQVWGCSSMGAIRAWELRHEGMHGHGWVYAQFARHADFTDDEMAQLHFPMPPWEGLSEPLVNLRHALWERGEALGIAPRTQRRLIELLRTCWFGDRTTELIADLLCGPLAVPPAAARALLAHLARRRVKNLDLEDLLRRRPWVTAPRHASR